MRSFLWSHGELRRGHAKVKWKDVCLLKCQGGLGIKALNIWNISFIAKHIWNVVSQKDSLWVKWVSMYRLIDRCSKGRNFWDVPVFYDSCWGWRKLLMCRDVLRMHFVHRIGDGSQTSVWFDNWLSLGPLSLFISKRDIYQAGLSLDCKVCDIVERGDFSISNVWADLAEEKPMVALHKPINRSIWSILQRGIFDWDVQYGSISGVDSLFWASIGVMDLEDLDMDMEENEKDISKTSWIGLYPMKCSNDDESMSSKSARQIILFSAKGLYTMNYAIDDESYVEEICSPKGLYPMKCLNDDESMSSKSARQRYLVLVKGFVPDESSNDDEIRSSKSAHQRGILLWIKGLYPMKCSNDDESMSSKSARQRSNDDELRSSKSAHQVSCFGLRVYGRWVLYPMRCSNDDQVRSSKSAHQRGFLDSGDKKKKKDGDGVKKDVMDEAANVGIAVKVKFIDGKLRKPIRGAPITMDVAGPPTKSILKKVDNEKGEASNSDLLQQARPKESSTKVHFRALVNDEKLESFDCVLPKAAASKYVSNTWRKFRFEKITSNDDGVYLFKFASKSGMYQVLEKGPWLIRKSPIILNKWTPSVSLKKGEIANVHVWVKMYNVLVLAYLEDGLSLIATQIGKPIMLDAFTSSMCMESWGRISFARALIEVSASFALKKEVIMAVLEDEGDGYVKEVIRIEYEWKPPHYVDCQSFGHDSKLCPKRVREEVPNNSARDTKATTMKENDDGLTEVKSRKKKKGVDFGWIRLNKPKSMVMWQQKKGVDAKSNSTSPSASSNAVGNDKGVSNLGLNTSNPFDVLNMDGDAMGESGTQPKVSEYVSSDLNENSPPEKKKWDVNNEDDTTDDEDVFNSYGDSFGGGNQLEDEDFDFYEGYADQVVDLDGALKEFRDFKLSMSGR
nr:hypothetical protein [Tanacetum cinerariifolium]